MTIRLVHPVTNHFVAEFDAERGLLYVRDRGRDGVIDLVRAAQQAGVALAWGGTVLAGTAIYPGA